MAAGWPGQPRQAGGPSREVSELWITPVGEGRGPVGLNRWQRRVRLPRLVPDRPGCSMSLTMRSGISGSPPGGPAGDAETVLRWRGEISGLAPLADGRLVAVVASNEQTDDDERRLAEHDDAMAWSERAVRQHWLWHRLRLLNLVSGELTVAAGLAGRHVVGMVQRPDGGPLAVMSWDCPDYDPAPSPADCTWSTWTKVPRPTWGGWALRSVPPRGGWAPTVGMWPGWPPRRPVAAR